MNELLKESFISEINYLRLFFGIFLLITQVYLISFFYVKYSTSRDNKSKFVRNLIPFGLSILLIVSVIKSSLALSLGLVGALSIIRFRTAVKESEQLTTYLMVMAIAISIAAEKELISIIIVLFYVVFFAVQEIKFRKNKNTKYVRIGIGSDTILNTDQIDIKNKDIKLILMSKSLDNVYNIEYNVTTKGGLKILTDHFNLISKNNISIDFFENEETN